MQDFAATRVRGVVLDLWNTIAYNDHRPNPVVALGDAFGLRGQSGWTRIIERGMMLERLAGIEAGIEALSRLTGNRLGPEQSAELARIWRAACARTRLFPEVPEILGRLAGRFRLGLLSNSQSFDLEFLDRPDLPFRARLFSFEMRALKPDPTLFLRMAELLDLPPAGLLMVGDNLEDDVLGAEAATMQAFLLRRRDAPLSFQEVRPDRESLSSLDELADILGV